MLLLLLTLSLVLIALVSGAAAVVRAAGRQWLREWVERQLGGGPASTARVVRPSRLLLGAAAATALLLALAGVAIGASITQSLPIVLASLAFSFAVLFAAYAVPRAIGQALAPRLERAVLPGLSLTTQLLRPAFRAAELLALPFTGEPRINRPATEREEIEELLREGELEGTSEPEELEFISGVVQFGERLVGEVMTPRTEVFALDIAMPPRELALAIAGAGYSRVPVYRESLDDIVGMIHVFDILDAAGEKLPAVREVKIAPESKPCREMLFEMLREQQHLAVILDEFGGTAGIVTLEDLLEEIVGDIRDEHDEPAAPETRRPSRASLVDGAAELRELARRFNAPLDDELLGDVQTVNGALMRAVGRIPYVGERFQLGVLEITVVETEPTRVKRALVQRIAGEQPAAIRISG
ncbi:MAG TPA: hemolysin family protein [Gemmatimonadaceae bacterium]|nr:hemolysin family protein [Gemmatimonadaceae bacterium]